MEFLGVGPMELLLILVIALIVLGPNDMVKTGRMLGRFLRQIVTSPLWKTIQDTSHNLRDIPTRLMREAGMDEEVEEVRQIGRDLEKEAKMLDSLRHPFKAAADDLQREVKTTVSGLSTWTTPPAPGPAPQSDSAPPPNLSAWITPPGSQSEVFHAPDEPPAPPRHE